MTDQFHDREDVPGSSRDSTDETPGEPRRRFKFSTAFTVLFFALVIVWIMARHGRQRAT